MKRLSVFLCFFALLLFLVGCGNEKMQNSYTVGNYTVTYADDSQSGTITDGTNTYGFLFTPQSDGHSVTLTYPDGSSYYWTQTGDLDSGGWSNDYDPERYVAGTVLLDILETGNPKTKSEKNELLILLLLIIGVFNTLAPRMAWHLETGWKMKDAEPSKSSLLIKRIVGAIALLAAVIMILQ